MMTEDLLKLMARILLFIAKNDYEERYNKLGREDRDSYLIDISELDDYVFPPESK